MENNEQELYIRKAPLIEEESKNEFQKQLSKIQESIDKRGIEMTPEQYWEELEKSVQFVEFDNYVGAVDKLIEDTKDDEEIYIYYPEDQQDEVEYKDEGNIVNSNTFMIRLLKARMDQQGIEKKLNVVNEYDIQGNGVKKVYFIDDASYSGAQLVYNNIANIPPGVESHIYLAGITSKTETALENALEEMPPESSYSYGTKIKTLRESLSPDAQKIFVDVFTELNNPGEDYTRRLDQPLVITPFKLPDATSQVGDRSSKKVYIENFSPIKQLKDSEKYRNSYYIDPKFLLDTDKYSGYKKEA